tara:strand:+ start:1044 stop:1391 length:348 start_codon:yes stop_codon:yes gene_type:complete
MVKILVVDDDKADLETMKTLLEKENYDVVTAVDGSQALENLTEDDLDLVLVDIKMPTLSGYDLLRLMREKVNHHVKMIYVSIVPEKDVSMEDIDGFIQKPFNPDDFLNKVKEVLS